MTLQEMMVLVLGPMAGVAAQAVTRWVINEWADSGKEMSPRSKRHISYAANVAVPTVVYLLGYALGYWPYELATHITHVIASFTTAQIVHGVGLPSGKAYEYVPKDGAGEG